MLERVCVSVLVNDGMPLGAVFASRCLFFIHPCIVFFSDRDRRGVAGLQSVKAAAEDAEHGEKVNREMDKG